MVLLGSDKGVDRSWGLVVDCRCNRIYACLQSFVEWVEKWKYLGLSDKWVKFITDVTEVHPATNYPLIRGQTIHSLDIYIDIYI